MPKGGKREGAGRKKSSERKSLVQKLSPYEDGVLKVLCKEAKAGNPPFVKMYMEYLHGKPDQFVAMSAEVSEVQTFTMFGRKIVF